MLLSLTLLLPAGIWAGGLAALQQAELEIKKKADKAKEEEQNTRENSQEEEQANEEGEDG